MNAVLLAAVLGAGAPQPPLAPPPREADQDFVAVKFLLPVQDPQVGTVAKWGLAAPVVDGFSDPNRIVYDDDYIKHYLPYAIHPVIKCGTATYTIATPGGVVEYHGGLDQTYLGQKFRAEDLIRFLKTRTEGKRAEKTFRVRDPELMKWIPGHPKSGPNARPVLSPWDRDTEAVITLLSGIQYKPAYPYFKALVKDPSPQVRYWAVIALGRLAPVVPEAVDTISPLLADKELRGAARDALTVAGKVAVPALITAMDHKEWGVRNSGVFALARMDFDAAVPGLLAALNHTDKEVRSWGASVVGDMSSRGVKITDERVAAAYRKVKAEQDR
jgi:hypothetical protein